MATQYSSARASDGWHRDRESRGHDMGPTKGGKSPKRAGKGVLGRAGIWAVSSQYSQEVWGARRKSKGQQGPRYGAHRGPKIPKTSWMWMHPHCRDVTQPEVLQKSESRDQRAFAWTLYSLTDDSELVPFLEAIPEAIHGVKGFHLVNDYLFIPLLNTPSNIPSLASRIADLIISCQNMASDDPRRHRGLVAGMKVIWALGMISGRTGDLFKHGEDFWFAGRIVEAVDQELNALAFYAISATAAMTYSRMNNIRNRAGFLARRPPGVELVEEVNTFITSARLNSSGYFSCALKSKLHSLEACSERSRNFDPTSDLQDVLKSLTHRDIWLEANVTIVSEFLIQAACLVSDGGDLPYEWDPPPQRSLMVGPDYRSKFDPTKNRPVQGVESNLDWIMRCFLRIVPFITPEDAAPILSVYLARRDDQKVLELVTREYCLPVVISLLVDSLQPNVFETDTLRAICTVFVQTKYRRELWIWDDKVEQLWAYMIEQSRLTAASPLSISLFALMTVRKQQNICFSTFHLRDPNHIDYDPSDLGVHKLRALAADPRLPGGSDLDEECSPEDIVANIHIRGKQATMAAVTDFLGLCVRPTNEAIIHERGHVMTSFAQAWVALAGHLVEHPMDEDLHATTKEMFFWTDADNFAFYHPATAPIFKEAFLLYRHFLEQRYIRDN
ncbi:hypothetical protein DFH09DRAFT_1112031 [Mycena vulgaris]|nr:hypothetical protein DFH09DRAFT_1112031 [Mycena vulgaris]